MLILIQKVLDSAILNTKHNRHPCHNETCCHSSCHDTYVEQNKKIADKLRHYTVKALTGSTVAAGTTLTNPTL